jgi:hypothetical protein
MKGNLSIPAFLQKPLKDSYQQTMPSITPYKHPTMLMTIVGETRGGAETDTPSISYLTLPPGMGPSPHSH